MAWLIRIYDAQGRLLFIAGTKAERPTHRLRVLRAQKSEWWGLVDESKTLMDETEDDDFQEEYRRALEEERPKYWRDSQGRRPYLRLRPSGSDYSRRLLANGPLSRISRRRAE